MVRPKPSQSIKQRHQRFQRGNSLVEALAASLIVGTCVAALVSVLFFSQGATNHAIDAGVAYNLARQTIEGIKETGFSNTPEAPASSPSIAYYDGQMNKQNASTTTTRYIITTTVVSDQTVSGSNPVQPTTTALRTVTVKVKVVQTGEEVCRMDTYLANEGV